ncbi:MAG: hypothetical protein PHF83_06565 [Candidatus Methanomethylophilus sp.]|nr:hypothetical protein [Methanomethylophilus sp.]
MKQQDRPRDGCGRYVTNSITYVVVDDFGNVSPYSRKEKTFGYATTTAKDLRPLNELAVENRRRHHTEKEVKASGDSLWKRVRMAVKLRGLHDRTAAYYVDKKRPPHGWDVDKKDGGSDRHTGIRRTKTRREMLDYTLDRTLDRRKGNYYFVIDEHCSTKNKPTRALCRSKSRAGLKVDGGTYSSDVRNTATPSRPTTMWPTPPVRRPRTSRCAPGASA